MIKTLKSYFFWTHRRGSFHYDVMVTLILVFIFVTPHLWSYGDKPVQDPDNVGTTQVIGDGQHGLIVTVPFNDVHLDLSSSPGDWRVKRALHQAIEPVTGDAVAVTRWETVNYLNGKPTAWRVWAHR